MINYRSKIRILILGEEYHAKAFYEQLKNYETGIFEPKYIASIKEHSDYGNFDLFHLISTPLPVIRKLSKFKKPIFYHWIGTDVYRFINDNFIMKYFKKLTINSGKVQNLVVSQNLKIELQKLNIDSMVLPLTKLNFNVDIMADNKKLSVLSYVPKNRWDFYHGETILELASRLPEIDFHILAAGEKNIKKPNVFFYDFIDDVTPFYQKCSVLIRLTIHDGLPKMVLEALFHGLQVIWNEQFPFCHQASNINDCLSILKKLESNCPVNLEGRKFIKETFSESKLLGDYTQMCNEILGRN